LQYVNIIIAIVTAIYRYSKTHYRYSSRSQ